MMSDAVKSPTPEEGMDRLNDALQSYRVFADQLEKNPKAYVDKHFKSLSKKRFTSNPDNVPPPLIKNARQEWARYLQTNTHSPDVRSAMLSLGLRDASLIEEEAFFKFVQRQPDSPKMTRWVSSFVCRFVALNPNYHSLTPHWLKHLEKKVPIYPERLPQIKAPSSYTAKSHDTFITKTINNALHYLNDDNVPMVDVAYALTDYFKAVTLESVRFYETDTIVHSVMSRYFDWQCQMYLASRTTTEMLEALLENFCHPNRQESCERFIALFNDLKQALSTEEKKIIQDFCQGSLGDPRLQPADWMLLKELDREIYNTILYWFNEADFDLFFEFVFKGAPDEHGRKACWKRYLPYAVDFKVLLPKNRMQDFKQLVDSGQLTTHMKPLLNRSGLTSFVIRTPQVLIYETQETKNSSYVFDLMSLGVPSKSDAYPVRKIQAFMKNVFGEAPLPVYAKDLLAHTTLAPDGRLERNFGTSRHWRFRHDQQNIWHEAVRMMMNQVHQMPPRD